MQNKGCGRFNQYMYTLIACEHKIFHKKVIYVWWCNSKTQLNWVNGEDTLQASY